MKYLEEENKNLISLRSSLLTAVLVLTGGLFWLGTTDFPIYFKVFFIIFGAYIDFLFMSNIIYANKKIKENIGVLKNERR